MSDVIHAFTKSVPHWQPRIEPVSLETATCEQRDALQITPSNQQVSDYVLVLAHDPEILKVRSPLFNTIMYHKGGLGRAERELGALAASVVNRCIYCAAVHADRHAQLTKSDAVVGAVFADEEAARLEPRDQAIYDFAVALSKTPSRASPQHIRALKDAGLATGEILDLILSAALFGWANRLMHVLGDPVDQKPAGH